MELVPRGAKACSVRWASGGLAMLLGSAWCLSDAGETHRRPANMHAM